MISLFEYVSKKFLNKILTFVRKKSNFVKMFVHTLVSIRRHPK